MFSNEVIPGIKKPVFWVHDMNEYVIPLYKLTYRLHMLLRAP
jgi:hypothetical protein